MRPAEGVSNGSRRALCIGVGGFASNGADDGQEPDPCAFADLDFAAECTRELYAALVAAGYDAEIIVDSAALKGARLGERVERYLTGGGVVVVHVLSHGECTADGGVYVVGSDGVRSRRTRVEDWRIAVNDDPAAPLTLFLLDLCYAGAANRYWQPKMPDAQERAWVIAAAGADERAYSGRFTQAVTAVINGISSGEFDLASTVRMVSFDVLFDRICKRVRELALDACGYLQDPVCTPVMGAYPELPFFPNPHYECNPVAEAAVTVESAAAAFLDPALDEGHFRDRAAGHGLAAGRVAMGCFTGRVPQVRELSAWMDGEGWGGVIVVTGSPGAGKSALLGLLVCAAHPGLRRVTQNVWWVVADRPSENPELAAVHARQRSLADILRSLVAQLHLDLDAAGSTPSPVAVIDAIVRRVRPPVVVVDALDEALDSRQLVAQLLIPLARARRSGSTPACRLLIGMRPWSEFTPLRELATDIGKVIDLDGIPAEQRHQDVKDYVVRLLELLPGFAIASVRAGRRAFAEAVAKTLVADSTTPLLADGRGAPGHEVRWGEFLVASLYTHAASLHSPDQLTDPVAAARLGALVPRTLPDVLELDLAARPGSRWRRPVLIALAHARGAGMPRSVLLAVCAAIDEEPGTPSVGQVDDELEALRFYLRTSADTDSSTLYRLFHQGLVDYLRAGRDGD